MRNRLDRPNPMRMYLALTLVAASLSAGEQPSPAPTDRALDLDACVRIAVAENPLLRAAEEGVAFAAESVGIARAAYYPEVALDARYRRFDTHVFLPSGLSLQESSLGATDDWSTALRAGYTVYDSGVRRAESNAAIAVRESASHSRERVRQDVVLAVHQAYFRVLSTEAARSAVEARMARSRDHLELAMALKQAGAVPQADVLRARVEEAGARLALVQADGDSRIAYGDLATAMGLPAALPLTVVDQMPVEAESSPHDDEEALGRALEQRAELKAAQERISAAEHQVVAIEGSYKPHVRAELAFGLRDSELLPEDQDWSVGASVQVPIFSGFAKSHRMERAAIETKILEAEAEAVSNRIRQEVWTASSRLESATEGVRQAEALQDEAQQSLGFARARYEAGAGTINDLLDAESMLTAADAAQVTAVLSYRVAKSLLLRAQGDL
ncbi:MAG: TolC family protein [Thermoanaerobaculia bacterium]|nr:TolC family protein [Thermoanaerobaculia bacterium]